MTLQLEITNPQDAELILSLVRRLNIPFKQTKKKVVEKSEREKAIGQIGRIKSNHSPLARMLFDQKPVKSLKIKA